MLSSKHMFGVATELCFAAMFVVLSIVYYLFDLGVGDVDKVFITITTFFFAIFIGFFLNRQSSRYAKIREIISTFDGKMQSIYRAASNINEQAFTRITGVIRHHYEKILEAKQWDYYFTHPLNTISSIHQILEETVGGNKQESLRNQAIGRVLTGLADCQVLRKNMVMTSGERITPFQWLLIYVFLGLLLVAASILPSQGFLIGSLLKAGFVTGLTATMVMLRGLDEFTFFGEMVGRHSAQDVLDILDGKK